MVEALLVAYYITGHGLGHAARAIEVCKHLVERGHSLLVVSAAPADFFQRQIPPARFLYRKAVLDSGSLQLDPFVVDMKGSLDAYVRTIVVHRDALLEQEKAWLLANKVDLVVSDVVPLACAAAAAAGVPAVCVSNFSWDFVYSEYVTSQRKLEYQDLVWQIAHDYSDAVLLLRLPGYVPMPAFAAVEDVPLVARKAVKPRAQVREELGLRAGEKLAVMIMGGHKGGLKLASDFLPAGWKCLICAGRSWSGDNAMPDGFIMAAEDVYTPDVINAADCVLGKIGYGTTSECLAHQVPLVFVRREGFNEEPFLRKLLEVHQSAVEMRRRDFLAGHWGPYLERAASLLPCYNAPTNGAEVVAARLEEVWVRSTPHSGRPEASDKTLRLRDTIVLGYLMKGPNVADSHHDVPEWYVRGLQPATFGSCPGSGTPDDAGGPEEVLENWQLLNGDGAKLESLPDTCRFLRILSTLDDLPPPSSPGASPAMELAEVRAARGLFRWEDELFVGRAPGRLDVMGGIADYSGSLVLQLPLEEACHAAVQLHPLSQQRLWRHMEARHQRLGGPRAALRVVSCGAEVTNRAAAFDMDLDDLYDSDAGGQPIEYHDAKAYFKKDAATSWAAYVAGALLVLARERGVRWGDRGISIFIYSDVPEGKGVSSSAAVEVAVMSGLLAAIGLQVPGREVALLCQKVENLVVGAPCGIMDQMASVLGRRDQLMAMVCQPAEVQEHVPLPPHLTIWGVDSGIRHSVGGADYASVRVGAFMGLRIASELMSASSSLSLGSSVGRSHSRATLAAAGKGGAAQNGRMALPAPAPVGGGYLANISPSDFAERVEPYLPAQLCGEEFLERYGTHYDAVTTVSPEQQYDVAAPAAHPVLENFRVASFRVALLAGGSSIVGEVLGELMLQSHVSYSRCGLGSDGTDRLVELVRAHIVAAKAAKRQPAVLGAKITGGGCGGTVCILGTPGVEGEAAVQDIVRQYAQDTGHTPQVFRGSSMGAETFGHLRLLRRLPLSQPASGASAAAAAGSVAAG